MKRRDSKVKTYRDYLDESARRGNKEAIYAINELDSPTTEVSPYVKEMNNNIKRKIWIRKNNI